MKVEHFNSVAECIISQEQRAKRVFEAKHKMKYEDKCHVHNCIKKAEFIWKPSVWISIKSAFKGMNPHPFTPQYCKEHCAEQTLINKFYPVEGFKEIKSFA